MPVYGNCRSLGGRSIFYFINISEFGKEVTVCFPDGQGSTSTSYRPIPSHIGVASYGALGHVPPRLPARYFGDHSLYRLRRVMRTVFCPVERFLAIGSAGGNSNFVIFCPQFSSGSNYSSQNAGTIANKFQLHTYFRFR